MLEVAACVDETDEQVSLDVYNAVWPSHAFTMDDVRSFKASVRDHVDCVARIDGVAVGSATDEIAGSVQARTLGEPSTPIMQFGQCPSQQSSPRGR